MRSARERAPAALSSCPSGFLASLEPAPRACADAGSFLLWQTESDEERLRDVQYLAGLGRERSSEDGDGDPFVGARRSADADSTGEHGAVRRAARAGVASRRAAGAGVFTGAGLGALLAAHERPAARDLHQDRSHRQGV